MKPQKIKSYQLLILEVISLAILFVNESFFININNTILKGHVIYTK